MKTRKFKERWKSVSLLSFINFLDETMDLLILNSMMQLRKIKFSLKGNAQFVLKVTFEPLMDFKQNNCRS